LYVKKPPTDVVTLTGDLFGTTGVRKVYGTEIDLDMVLKLGKAIGTFLESGTILLARDARTTGKMIADTFCAGVLSTGVNVTRAGIIPTPTLAFMTKKGGYDAGVMITASHNPPEYTGIKFWSADSMGYTKEQENRIEEIYTKGEFRQASWDSLGQVNRLETAAEQHIRAVIEACDSEAIKERCFTIVVDPGNGAACVLTPYLLRDLVCKLVTINGHLDGHFPGRKSEPEEETLGDLISMVKYIGADLGVAHDGDSDRVVFVTQKGEVIRGDRVIALLAKEALKQSAAGSIVTTVDSSKVLDEVVGTAGGKALRTPVGDIQVAIKVKQTEALLGGEACGVYILPQFHMAPEPFLATCQLLEMMAKTGRSFGDLISEIPVYPLKKAKIKCLNEKKKEVMEKLQQILKETISDVQDVLTVDGIELSTKLGRVLVRPSGTEPVIRITCEAQTEEAVDTLLKTAEKAVTDTVSGS
jgi:phosphoglucosamine mutase